ncbi:MAG: glycosyltransferase family 39 protein [Bacteroidota bacterium]
MKIFNYLFERKFLFFLCIAFVLYGNTLKNGYGLDDQFVTENNYTNKGLKTLKKIFTSYYAENDGKNNYEYRPIVKVSFALEHQLFGVKPWIGHLINIILYGLCIFLLFKVLLRIFHDYPEAFSLYITLIFAVLPVHSEVVASLKNRDVLLCFAFSMLLLKHVDDFFKHNHYKYLLYAILFSALGFLTKYDILPFLAIAPIIFYKKYKFSLKPFLAFVLVFALGFLSYRILKKNLLDKSISERIFLYSENPLFFENSFLHRLSTALNSLGFYVKMLFFPSNMTCYYGYKTLDIFNFISAYALLGLASFVALLYGFFKLLKSRNPIWIALVFFGISISMYLNIMRVVAGIVADRYLFFSSIGFSVLMGYLFLKFLNKNDKPLLLTQTSINFKLISVLIAVSCLFIVLKRNSEWENKLLLYEHDVKKRPTSIALNLLFSKEVLNNINTSVYFNSGRDMKTYVEQARVSLNNVLEIDSMEIAALNNLAFIYQNIDKDYKKAIPLHQKALLKDSTKFEVLYNYAYCLYMIGENQKAQHTILKVYVHNSDNQQVLDLMSYILVANKKWDLGIQLFKEIAERNPENNSTNMILGNFYIASGDLINAKNYYSIALENDPGNSEIRQIVSRLSK